MMTISARTNLVLLSMAVSRYSKWSFTLVYFSSKWIRHLIFGVPSFCYLKMTF